MLEKYEKWTNKFMESWKELDWEKTLSLMDFNVKYYENPIDEPCQSFDEVKKLWEIVEDNQKDITYKYEIIAYNDNLAIVNWQMTRTFIPTNEVQDIDGIFEISLNEEGLLTNFKQWRFTRTK